jgi:hypothetical protein
MNAADAQARAAVVPYLEPGEELRAAIPSYTDSRLTATTRLGRHFPPNQLHIDRVSQMRTAHGSFPEALSRRWRRTPAQPPGQRYPA